MAAPGGGGTLLAFLALLGLLGSASAFFLGFRPKPPMLSSPLQFLAGDGCVPEDFIADLPESINSSLAECLPGLSRSVRSPQPFGRRGGRRGGHGMGMHSMKAKLMGCVADRLNITFTDGELDDRAALDAVLESLSSDTTFTDQLKANADTCLAANTSSLEDNQLGVYLLSCLKQRQMATCENASLCLNAAALKKCPLSIKTAIDKSAIDKTEIWNCIRGMFSSSISGLFGGGLSAITDICPKKEDMAMNIANCSLQAASLASGDTVDVTALGAAINASPDTTDSQKALQQAALSTCQADTAVEAFLDCWVAETTDDCIISSAEMQASSYTGNGEPLGSSFGTRGSGPRGRGPGLGPFGQRGGGRPGRAGFGSGFFNGRRRGG